MTKPECQPSSDPVIPPATFSSQSDKVENRPGTNRCSVSAMPLMLPHAIAAPSTGWWTKERCATAQPSGMKQRKFSAPFTGVTYTQRKGPGRWKSNRNGYSAAQKYAAIPSVNSVKAAMSDRGNPGLIGVRG